MNKKSITTALLAAVALSSTACQFHARSAEAYRDATQELLQTRQSEIKGCYDDLLKTDSTAAGVVKIDFKVEAETGKITEPAVDPNGTTAPAALGECIVNTIDGLVLDPPDQRTGVASFQYEFKVNPRG